jgi:hypothetical protein
LINFSIEKINHNILIDGAPYSSLNKLIEIFLFKIFLLATKLFCGWATPFDESDIKDFIFSKGPSTSPAHW